MNFYERVKQDIIDTIHSNSKFKDLTFIENIHVVNPNNWNINRGLGLVAVEQLNKIDNDTFCNDYMVSQNVAIQYHVKPDMYHNDWESNLNMVQAYLIYTLESALRDGSLFSIPYDFDFTFKNAMVFTCKRTDIDEKIFSKCCAINYTLKYDLGKVIDYE